MKGIENIDLIENRGQCFLGGISGAKRAEWDYKIHGFLKNNEEVVLAEFQRASTGLGIFGLEIKINDTPYSCYVKRVLEKYALRENITSA